ncbi:hypothetical protein MRB53_022219 [Persea americana]|uniref:Uncharacterized protein n=1 Tax=Persea americana TaxID=3435 RepID=A0ACC2L6T9_PERAE|nr:hypothetical protein MRB53_022219 [Persea americana]
MVIRRKERREPKALMIALMRRLERNRLVLVIDADLVTLFDLAILSGDYLLLLWISSHSRAMMASDLNESKAEHNSLKKVSAEYFGEEKNEFVSIQ